MAVKWHIQVIQTRSVRKCWSNNLFSELTFEWHYLAGVNHGQCLLTLNQIQKRGMLLSWINTLGKGKS